VSFGQFYGGLETIRFAGLTSDKTS